MADRELLELAAKAAGRVGTYQHWEDSRDNVSCGIAPAGSPGREWWNPLRDDGEALRLAVKLRMRIHHDGSCANVEGPTGQKYCWVAYATVEGNDHFAAMRNAIVRAAAEIGKALP